MIYGALAQRRTVTPPPGSAAPLHSAGFAARVVARRREKTRRRVEACDISKGKTASAGRTRLGADPRIDVPRTTPSQQDSASRRIRLEAVRAAWVPSRVSHGSRTSTDAADGAKGAPQRGS